MILKRFIIGVILSILCFHTVLAQESYNRLLFEGNRSFKEKDYENSASKFKSAIRVNEKDFAAHYNLGNAYYKTNQFEEARTEFEKAQQLAKNKNDKAAALYNLGNSYMKTNKPDKAAEFYKQSLKQDPYNEKIRKNYEIAMLKEKEKQNQKNKDQKNESDKDQNKGNGQDKDQNKGDEQKKQNGEGQKSQNPTPNGGQGDKQSQNPKEENEKMPKDLEEALLNRASSREKETAKKILNKNSFSMPQSNEKDW